MIVLAGGLIKEDRNLQKKNPDNKKMLSRVLFLSAAAIPFYLI
ncbi:hypothetical protein QFZ31_006808 [Neobacillus niacini]|nr:hypothetical protein [Neobacillus niacini]